MVLPDSKTTLTSREYRREPDAAERPFLLPGFLAPVDVGAATLSLVERRRPFLAVLAAKIVAELRESGTPVTVERLAVNGESGKPGR